jgi:anti-sigma factor (TIGR02949 family)
VSCDDVTYDLDAYMDRELDAEAAAVVRTHLRECPGCARRLAERETLGALVRATPYHAAPDRLRARLRAGGRAAWLPRRLAAWAAAAVVVMTAGGGWLLVSRLADTRSAVVDAIVDGHVRSLQATHLVDVESSDHHTVKPWFLGKVDFAPPVVDLADAGFPLVGGRLDYLEGRPVAALVYRRRQHAINVFVRPEDGTASAGIDRSSRRGFHLRHWIRDGMSCWAVSDVNDTELDEFTEALQSR